MELFHDQLLSPLFDEANIFKGLRKHHRRNKNHHRIHSQESGNTEITPKVSDDLTFHIMAKFGYHFPHSKKHEKVAILDYHYNVSVFYDGLSGEAFAFSYEEGRGVYIPSGVSDKTWNVKEQSFEDYFKNPFPPKHMFTIGERLGSSFDGETISDVMSEKLSKILTPLSLDYSSQCQALATALQVSKITSNKLKTSLSSFEKIMGDVSTPNRSDFKFLIWIYQGLGDFFELFGGIDVLNKNHIHLDFPKILNEKGAFHVLSYLLETLAPHFDLRKVVGKHMNCEFEFFILINKLGGELEYGSDGVIYILTEITKYNYGRNSKENLLVVLRKYCTDPRGSSHNLKRNWRDSVQILQATIKKLKLEEAFKDLYKLLKDIEDCEWKQKGVDMSAVLQEIFKLELPGKAESADRIFEKIKTKLYTYRALRIT